MPVNTSPIFPLTPKVEWGTVETANTSKDGTGEVVTVFEAGTNGARIDQIKVRALGTNVATVMRFFLNNGSASTTATNNSLVHESTIDATTLSETSELADNDITIEKNGGDTVPPIPYLPAGHKINITVGTTIAAGLQITVHGGDY